MKKQIKKKSLGKKKQSKKRSKSRARHMTAEQKATYLKNLDLVLSQLAKDVIADMKPYKCFMILQDKFGNGITRASDSFSVDEFSHYAKAILEKNKITL